MKKIKILFTIYLLLILTGSKGIYSQEEIKIKITEGIPLITVALPQFDYSGESQIDDKTKNEIYDTLWNDLKYSRVFKLIPKEHYTYLPRQEGSRIVFKDWASIQAKVLIKAVIDVSPENRILFSIKVYDIDGGKLVFGRNFGGKKEFLRLISHRAADEMMKHFGEKPIFTSKIVYVSNRDKNKEIYIMDYDGKRPRRITYNNYIDLMPSWSVDKEKILYTSYKKGSPDLFQFNLYSGRNEVISSGGVNYRADWALDENKVVYTSSKRDKNAEIYVRFMDSGKEKRLTYNHIIDSSPCWSPNGNEIAFTSQRGGTPQIYVMNSDGTNVRRVTYEGTYHDNPAWSPDGSRIAYVSRIEGRFDIYLLNIKNNSISKLTENSGRNENPTWSPDSRHIIFSSNRSGFYQLYSMDYDGSNLKKLTYRGENKMPKWQKFK
ncbi:MAG: DUF5050 domain-containing protein [Acidobacteriota bacterium]